MLSESTMSLSEVSNNLTWFSTLFSECSEMYSLITMTSLLLSDDLSSTELRALIYSSLLISSAIASWCGSMVVSSSGFTEVGATYRLKALQNLLGVP